MKTILVPTDLSPMTTQALDVAVELARTNGAEVVLLHTVLNELTAVPDPIGGFAYDINPIFQEAWKEAEEALDKFRLNPAYEGVTITTKIGSNIVGLIRTINDQEADLIVLASKGATGLKEWLEGSNAELIVRYATCPVLVVKEPIPSFNPQNILYGIDLDEGLKKPHPVPFQLVGNEHSTQQFVYVLTPTDNREPDGIREWVDTYAQATDLGPYTLKIWHDQNVPEGIINYAETINADLIVLYTHGYTGLLHWLQGSVAEDVLNHAQIPVLIMRA